MSPSVDAVTLYRSRVNRLIFRNEKYSMILSVKGCCSICGRTYSFSLFSNVIPPLLFTRSPKCEAMALNPPFAPQLPRLQLKLPSNIFIAKVFLSWFLPPSQKGHSTGMISSPLKPNGFRCFSAKAIISSFPGTVCSCFPLFHIPFPFIAFH